MSEPRCPKCGSTTLAVERRIDGDAKCACGWSGKYALCFESPEQKRIKCLEAQLAEAEEVLRWYADENSWEWTTHDSTYDGCGISDLTQHRELGRGPYQIGGKRARQYLEKWKVGK